mmetsp:Transcript_11902/g.28595  ORF Transcript_11902/g.28595 Transcript_11902/m.28595 type:complete len:711 (+) Transcript_11902:324-2456(+)
MNDPGTSSLLLQAAQSAAEADGLAVPPDAQLSNGGGGSVGQQQNGGNNNSLANQQAAAAAILQQQRQIQQQQQQIQQQQQQQAAAAQRKMTGGGGGSKKKGPALRRGKWTAEEEAYANRLIQEFKAGLLPLTDGTTLRTFLSKLLNCDPMRISKKFVGSNCIGKQVFRRRTADLNRLTPEQIQQSRAELSELERRFLERVAQTNRVKNNNSGGGGGGGTNGGNAGLQSMPPSSMGGAGGHPGIGGPLPASSNPFGMMGNVGAANGMGGTVNPMMMGSGVNANVPGMNPYDGMGGSMPNPPWMQPPTGYRPGMGAQMAAANLAGGQSNSRAAAAGRALLEGLNPGSGGNKGERNGFGGGLSAANMFAMAELQRRASQSNLGGIGHPSAQDLLAALQSTSSGNSLAQMARTASAARFGAFGSRPNNSSLTNLMLKTGFSRDQLSQMANDRGLSSTSLSNMAGRKNSFDALMSLEFQSLQSIDNLANLIQTGGNQSKAPETGLKNWSADASGAGAGGLSSAARRLASASNLEAFMRSLSNNNMNGNGEADAGANNSNLQSLLQGMSNGNLVGAANSMSSLVGAGGAGGANAASAASLANLIRENQSSTGLSALRSQDGAYNRNTSVEDFLSLMAAGDIPHQDASLLNLPLSQLQQIQQQQLQQQGANGGNKGQSMTNFELLQQMANQSNTDLKRKAEGGKDQRKKSRPKKRKA